MKFKKVAAILITLLLSVLLISCSTQSRSIDDSSATQITPKENFEEKDVLVVYFSQPDENSTNETKNGTTEAVAKIIQKKLGADIFKIETEKEYPKTSEEFRKAAQEEKDNNEKPKLKNNLDDISKYNLIILGYPIWCDDAPMAIYSFLEDYDLKGKAVLPFCTHNPDVSATGFANIKNALPNNNVGIGFEIGNNIVLSSPNETENRITHWLSTTATY